MEFLEVFFSRDWVWICPRIRGMIEEIIDAVREALLMVGVVEGGTPFGGSDGAGLEVAHAAEPGEQPG